MLKSFKFVSILTATVYSSALLAGPFDGIYRQNQNADCGIVGVDGGSLEIREGIFYGVEMECRMTRPVDVIDMDAILYTMQCTGEDDIWSERALLMNRAEGEGIIMLWNGYAFVYDRCTPAE